MTATFLEHRHPCLRRSPWDHFHHDNSLQMGIFSGRLSEVVMRSPVFIILMAVVLGVGAVLALMNNACKSGRRAWCSPRSEIQHHAKRPVKRLTREEAWRVAADVR